MRALLVALFIFGALGCEQVGVISASGTEVQSVAEPLSLSPSACDAAGAVALSAGEAAKEAARRVRRYCAQSPSARNCTLWIDRVEPAEAALVAANAEMIRLCTDADEIPGGSHCASVRTWPSAARQLELDFVALLNAKRLTATACGSTVLPPAAPLAMDAALRCASRLHSADMAARDFLAHTNPDGVEFTDRIEAAGYSFITASETIAEGLPTAREVLDAWLASPGQCETLVSGSFTEIGVGQQPGSPHWTVKLARARNAPPPPLVDPCAVTANWDAAAVQLETQVLQAINARRAAGATCGSKVMPRAAALTAGAKLSCVARYHSKNMATGGFFAHTSPWGETYFDRLDLVGYDYSFASEALASGFTTAATVVNGWMASPGHCELLLERSLSELGVGYVSSGNLWTAALAQPQ